MADQTFSQRLEDLVRNRGLKRSELQEMTGAGAGTVSEWFTQGSIPGGAFLARLAEGLGVSPEWLLEGRGQGPEDVIRVVYAPETAEDRARVVGQVVEEIVLSMLKSCRQTPTGDGSGRRPGDVETEKVPGTKVRPANDQ